MRVKDKGVDVGKDKGEEEEEEGESLVLFSCSYED